MKLQNVIINSKYCPNSELFYRIDKKAGRVSFNGFFNLLYLEKLHRYTGITALRLCLTLQGYKTLQIFHDKDLIESYNLSSEEQRSYQFILPYEQYLKGTFSFALLRKDNDFPMGSICGYYDALLEETTPIRIAAGFCTFKREEDIVHNLTAILSLSGWDTEENTEEVYNNLFIDVIDNGKTLSQQKECQGLIERSNGRIRIIPNENSGGSGGFTRAMQESLRRMGTLNLTHQLLMDDDVQIFEDLFVRLYGFINCLKAEYKNITVGGELFRTDYPDFINARGISFRNFEVSLQMHLECPDSLDKCISDQYCSTQNEKKYLSGWWCCCYSMTLIKDRPSLLPLFIHSDDVQYGLGLLPYGMTFINGVSVWHKGLNNYFTGVNTYYNIRNTLITEASFFPKTTGRQAAAYVWQCYLHAIFRYFYTDADLIYRAVSDFLKGEEYLRRLNPSRFHVKLSEYYKSRFQLIPLAEIADFLPLSTVEIQRMRNNKGFTIEELISFRQETSDQYIIKRLSLNGLLLPPKRGACILLPPQSLFAMFRYRQAVAYEPASGKAAVLSFDMKKTIKAFRQALRSMKMLRNGYEKAAISYRRYYHPSDSTQ